MSSAAFLSLLFLTLFSPSNVLTVFIYETLDKCIVRELKNIDPNLAGLVC
jgi:hypothetical protein